MECSEIYVDLVNVNVFPKTEDESDGMLMDVLKQEWFTLWLAKKSSYFYAVLN